MTEPPKPEEFGLTQEELSRFKRGSRRHPWLGVVLGWVCFFISFAFWSDTIVKEKFWPVLFVPFGVGFLLAELITRAGNLLRELSLRWHPSYPSYLAYRDAWSKHFQETENQREAELSKQRAIWEAERLREKERRAELRKQEAWWRQLDGYNFETELAKLLAERGYKVKRTGRTGDEGVDLLVVANGKQVVVQCKAHKNYISAGPVRELYGTLIHQKADEAWLVTTSGFFSGAKRFAHGKPIRLLTIREVLRFPRLLG